MKQLRYEDQQILGIIAQNLDAWATMHPEFVSAMTNRTDKRSHSHHHDHQHHHHHHHHHCAAILTVSYRPIAVYSHITVLSDSCWFSSGVGGIGSVIIIIIVINTTTTNTIAYSMATSNPNSLRLHTLITLVCTKFVDK
jgi:ABC-type Zn2+ transport system substrate-binding protein/surface adhesin